MICAADLALRMIADLEDQNISTVYLRNYENLPEYVGNDVDLLVPTGSLQQASYCLISMAKKSGWLHLKSTLHGCVGLYFGHAQTGDILHIDLFDRLSGHLLEYADCQTIISRRKFNGIVHIPDAHDEVFVNLMSRLIHASHIREHHRKSALSMESSGGVGAIVQTFVLHLGPGGASLAYALSQDSWIGNERHRRQLKRLMLIHHGLGNPDGLVCGIFKLLKRCAIRLLKPPGFIVMIAAKEPSTLVTLISQISPWLSQLCGGKKIERLDQMQIQEGEPINEQFKALSVHNTAKGRQFHAYLKLVKGCPIITTHLLSDTSVNMQFKEWSNIARWTPYRSHATIVSNQRTLHDSCTQSPYPNDCLDHDYAWPNCIFIYDDDMSHSLHAIQKFIMNTLASNA